jgi:colanic acid/amylovoran biosynthesis glycosyltransferase
VCRLVEKKGLADAIAACARVVNKYPKLHYTIFGDGPQREELEYVIRSLHVEQYITLAGWASQQQVVDALTNAHIFMLPSKKSSDGNEEGIPNALKEAMAMGVPVIATYHAGNSELIENGVSGFLVSEGNATEIAKKINYLIEHPEKWGAICTAARKKVEDEFEIGKTVEQLEQLFYQLLIEE